MVRYIPRVGNSLHGAINNVCMIDWAQLRSTVAVLVSIAILLVRPGTLLGSIATEWLDIRVLGNPNELARWVSRRSKNVRTTAVRTRRIRELGTSIGAIDDNIHRIERIVMVDSRIG